MFRIRSQQKWIFPLLEIFLRQCQCLCVDTCERQSVSAVIFALNENIVCLELYNNQYRRYTKQARLTFNLSIILEHFFAVNFCMPTAKSRKCANFSI